MATRPAIYGLMAEFDDPNALVAATYRAYHEGYRQMDAYSPFPIEELHEALGAPHSKLPLIVLIGGLLRRPRRLLPAVLDCRHHVPDQRRRAAVPQLAGVHPGDVRVHDSRGGAVGGARHARA